MQLELTDGEAQIYRLADLQMHLQFELAYEATEPRAAAAALPSRTPEVAETKAEANARRKAQEEAIRIESKAAAQADVAEVVRADGKRRATKAAIS